MIENNNYRKAKILGVISLVSSLVCLGLVGVITGHLSLATYKKLENKKGRGFSLAGVILGYLGIVAFITFCAASGLKFYDDEIKVHRHNEVFSGEDMQKLDNETLTLPPTSENVD